MFVKEGVSHTIQLDVLKSKFLTIEATGAGRLSGSLIEKHAGFGCHIRAFIPFGDA